MRRGPLLGITVFLACSIGGYRLGLHRRAERLKRERAAAERADRGAERASPPPAIEPVSISTESLEIELPSDHSRPESVPRALE